MHVNAIFSSRQKKIKGIGIVIGLVLLTIGFFWIKYGGIFLIVDRDDPDDVVLVFTLTLMQNKERLAKSLVAQEAWPQLDSWFDAHQATRCSFPLDGDTYMMGGINRSLNEEKNQYLYEFSIIDHACSGAFYFLSVKNVVVEQTERGWQIIEWEEPCDTGGLGAKECRPWQ
jgi:hypothetical protein